MNSTYMKQINTRIAQKHDLEANWVLHNPTFVPFRGEVVIFDAETENDPLPPGRTTRYTFPRIKIGNNVDSIMNLPFSSSIVQIVTWEDSDI